MCDSGYRLRDNKCLSSGIIKVFMFVLMYLFI